MASTSKLQDRITRGERQYPGKFDASELTACDASILNAFETGARVEVTSTYADGETFVRRGRVSTTTGWRPAFILMHRRSDSGSWDVLGPNDRVTAFVSV